MGGQSGNIPPVKANTSRLRRDSPRQQANEGRLPRPIRPDQRVNFTRVQVKIHPIHGGQSAEMPRQSARLQQGHGSHVSPRARNVPNTPLGANSTRTSSAAPTTSSVASV